MNEVKAALKVKNKEYLLGYVDCFISLKNLMGHQRIDISGNNATFSPEQNKILGPVYLDITCRCGYYIGFKTAEEIPDKSFKCPLCDDVFLIYYLDEKLCKT